MDAKDILNLKSEIQKTQVSIRNVLGLESRLRALEAGGAGSATDHSHLLNLDYAHAGHTGFQPALGFTAVPNTRTINGNPLSADVTLSIPAAQVQTDWNASTGMGVLLNKPTLAAVATSGSYTDLSSKPTIPTALSSLTDDTTHRLVTDTEISAWNAKQAALGFTPENVANKGAAGGYCPLGSDQKVFTANLPASVVGAMAYQGTFDCSGGSYPASPSKGYYYVCSVAGTISGVSYKVNDWLCYDGTQWDKIDNQTVVSSVAGKVGAVTLDHATDLANVGSNTHAQIDTALTRLGNTSGTNTGDQTLPVPTTGAAVNTGTNDTDFLTPKAANDSNLVFTDKAQTLTNKTLSAPVVDSLIVPGGGDLSAMGFDTSTLVLLPGFKDFMTFAHFHATITANTGTLTFTNPTNCFQDNMGFATFSVVNPATDTAILTVEFNTPIPCFNGDKVAFGSFFIHGAYNYVTPQNVTVELDRDGDGVYDLIWTVTNSTNNFIRTPVRSIGSPYTISKVRFTFSNWTNTGLGLLARLCGWNSESSMWPGYAAVNAPTFNNGLTVATGNVAVSAGTLTATNLSGTNTGDQTLPVKAAYTDINTGTDDAKFATSAAIANSNLVFTDKTQTLSNKTLTAPVVDSLIVPGGGDFLSQGFNLLASTIYMPGYQDVLAYITSKGTVTGNTGTVAFSGLQYLFMNDFFGYATATITNPATDTAIITAELPVALPVGGSPTIAIGWWFIPETNRPFPSNILAEVDYTGDGIYEANISVTNAARQGISSTIGLGAPYTIKKLRFTFSNWSSTGTVLFLKLCAWNPEVGKMPGYASISNPTFYDGLTVATGNLTVAGSAILAKIREAGGTDLTMGTITDGQIVGRTGTTLLGTTPTMATHSVPAGGTVGQALIKGSGTDYDTGWGTGSATARTRNDGRLVWTSDTVLTWNGYSIGLWNATTGRWDEVIPASAPTLANTANDLDSNALTYNAEYDIYAQYSSTTAFTLVAKKWTNDTTQAVVPALWQGRYCYDNTTDAGKGRLWLGTIRLRNASGTAKFTMDANRCFIFNLYNPLFVNLAAVNSGGAYTYTTSGVTRETNGGTGAVRAEVVLSQAQNVFIGGKMMITSNASGAAMNGVGINSTTSQTGPWAWVPSSNTQRQVPFATQTTLNPGYSYITILDRCDAQPATFESSNGGQGLIAFQLAA